MVLKSVLGSIYGCLKEACTNSFVTMKANLGSVLSSRPRSRRKSYCVMLNTEEEFRHRTSVLLRKECYLPSCVARPVRICGRKTKLLSCVAQAAMICGRKTNFTSCVARPAMICGRKTKLLTELCSSGGHDLWRKSKLYELCNSVDLCSRNKLTELKLIMLSSMHRISAHYCV